MLNQSELIEWLSSYLTRSKKVLKSNVKYHLFNSPLSSPLSTVPSVFLNSLSQVKCYFSCLRLKNNLYAFASTCGAQCCCTCMCECTHGLRTTPWTHATLQTKHRGDFWRDLACCDNAPHCFRPGTVMTLDLWVRNEQSDSRAGLHAIPAPVATAEF